MLKEYVKVSVYVRHTSVSGTRTARLGATLVRSVYNIIYWAWLHCLVAAINS